MNVSKSLASAVAAIAVVGSIGIAYAQTTAEGTPSPTSQPSDPNNRSLSSPSTMSGGQSGGQTSGSMQSSEPAPQADRG